jgi:deazaflavin-dependent oxidoreductase (nitroreductase family)
MASAAILVQKMLMQAHSFVYRATGGKVAGRMFKSPVLLLNTTGRKSGAERTTPLLYLQDGEDIAIVASNGGARQHPAWYLNLRANPEATVEIGDRKLRVRAEQASPEEKERLWPVSAGIITKFSLAIIEGDKCFRILAQSINLEEDE